MARLLEHDTALTAADETEVSEGAGRSTARALATALALLMISLLVVARSQAAFEAEPADADAAFSTGDVRLTDDDEGTTLFDIPDMVPGRPVSDCIAVTYEGAVLPADVVLAAAAEGALAPALVITVESGQGGGFQDCAGFEADETLYEGPLDRLAAGDPVLAFRAEETPAQRSFRFTFDLDPEVPVTGRATATADLEWSAEPS
jgi:hypothetical protein